VGGVGGVGGAPSFAGLGTPLMTDALIRHRDGIEGPWGGMQFFPARNCDDPAQLRLWDYGIRGAIFDFELCSHLFFNGEPFGGSADNQLFALWHVDDTNPNASPPALVAQEVVAMIRPTAAIFQRQLDYVDGYSDLREDRASEILTQMVPPVGFWSSITNLHPERHRYTIELLDVALRLADSVEMRFKHALACPRPVELSPQIQPMILTPGHGSTPMGHATEAFMAAYVLWTLLAPTVLSAQWRVQLMRQAARIAINRTVAGLHYPLDAAAGQLLGLTLADYFLHRAAGAGAITGRRFNGQLYDPNDDFNPEAFYDSLNGNPANPGALATPYFDVAYNSPIALSPILNWLWLLAQGEW
jgi:hypothetical protein